MITRTRETVQADLEAVEKSLAQVDAPLAYGRAESERLWRVYNRAVDRHTEILYYGAPGDPDKARIAVSKARAAWDMASQLSALAESACLSEVSRLHALRRELVRALHQA